MFSLGRLPADGERRRRAEVTADRLDAFLGGRTLAYGEAGHGLGVPPNSLRYAAPTGRVLIRWDGARQPTVWMMPPPAVDPADARLELARRFLHVIGPSTPSAFAEWAGVRPPSASATFDALDPSLTPVRTPAGDAWILAADEEALGAPAAPAAAARLLPSGDSYYLLREPDRALLVPEAERRRALWTSRVWPGAILVGGEVIGTWRRADVELTIEPWRRLGGKERDALQAEAEGLPLPGIAGRIRVLWVD